MKVEPLFIYLLPYSLSVWVNSEFSLPFRWKVSYQGSGPFFFPGHSLHGAAACQNRASRAAAMPLLICLLLKSVIRSTIDNIIPVCNRWRSKCNPDRDSPGTAAVALPPLGHSMKKSIHFQGMVFPKNSLCAWIAYTSLVLTPAFLLLHLACSHSPMSV